MEMEKIIQEKVEKEMQELESRIQKCYYSKSGVNEAKKYIKGLLSREKKRMADVGNIGRKHTVQNAAVYRSRKVECR